MNKYFFCALAIFLSICSSADETEAFDISGTAKGNLLVVEAHGMPLFIYKPTEKDLHYLEYLNKSVFSQSNSLLTKELPVYFLWGIGTRTGCLLKHFPERGLNNGNTWYGGYVDPCDFTSYDLSGRAISNKGFSYENISSSNSSLKSPNVKLSKEGVVHVDNFGLQH